MQPSDNVIPGFQDLTPQECFDLAATHILSTGQASINENGRCSYNGIGCAASPFLTPEARENLVSTWTTLQQMGLVPDANLQLIDQLQDAHDDIAGAVLNRPELKFMDLWRAEMREIARRFHLDATLVQEPVS